MCSSHVSSILHQDVDSAPQGNTSAGNANFLWPVAGLILDSFRRDRCQDVILPPFPYNGPFAAASKPSARSRRLM
jgi:hypothetical protein